MRLSWRIRRRLSLLILVLGLPLYVFAAVTVVGWFDRPPLLVELAIYVALGVAWVLPLRRLFTGMGRADPDSPDGE